MMEVYCDCDADGVPMIHLKSGGDVPLTMEEAVDIVQTLSEMLDDPMTNWYEE